MNFKNIFDQGWWKNVETITESTLHDFALIGDRRGIIWILKIFCASSEIILEDPYYIPIWYEAVALSGGSELQRTGGSWNKISRAKIQPSSLVFIAYGEQYNHSSFAMLFTLQIKLHLGWAKEAWLNKEKNLGKAILSLCPGQ